MDGNNEAILICQRGHLQAITLPRLLHFGPFSSSTTFLSFEPTDNDGDDAEKLIQSHLKEC